MKLFMVADGNQLASFLQKKTVTAVVILQEYFFQNFRVCVIRPGQSQDDHGKIGIWKQLPDQL